MTTLSPRQQQVAQLVADCCTNKQIAARMQISERQVETYLTVIADRWRLDRSKNIRAQIVARVIREAA